MKNIGLWIDGDATIKNITISHNIISEGLKSSIHPKGSHSMGVLIGDRVQNVSVVGNVFAHNASRNPQLKGGVNAEVVSNIIYNPTQPAIGLSNSYDAGPINTHIINNYFIPGSDTKYTDKHVSVNSNVEKNSKIFIADNYIFDKKGSDNWSLLYFKEKKASDEVSKMESLEPLWFLDLDQLSFEDILGQAGAFPDSRDQIDRRIILDVMNITGRQIDDRMLKEK